MLMGIVFNEDIYDRVMRGESHTGIPIGDPRFHDALKFTTHKIHELTESTNGYVNGFQFFCH